MLLSKRHIIKTFSWRIIGSLDTLLLSIIITSDTTSGMKISSLEFFSKIFLYYFHERFWFKYGTPNSTKRHIYKTISWRAIAILDTVIIVFLITGSIDSAIMISFFEIITKSFLYFIHEKLWYRIKYGIKR